jgi:hypothetical protein
MAGEEPQQPVRRRFWFQGLDPAKYAEIEADLERREQLRRERSLAAALESAAAVEPAQGVSLPVGPERTDWQAVAEGLRGLAVKLRQVAEEGPGPSPG